MATTILLVRHGETDWNRENRVQGHTDRPLNALGREQAAALALALAAEPFDAVYASDLARAQETARPIAESHGLEVIPHPGLREKSFGTWEGLLDYEVLERCPEAASGPWGDDETTEQMAKRVLRALHEIAARHPDGRVVVVSHGGPLRTVLRHCALDRSDRIANCGFVRIAVREGNIEAVD